MEDVLRMIYERERPRIPRENQVSSQKPVTHVKQTQLMKSRKRYPTTLSSYTQSTAIQSIDQKTNFSRKAMKGIVYSVGNRPNFRTIDQSELNKSRNQVNLPLIRMRKLVKSKKKLNQLRIAIHVVHFVIKMKRLRRKKMLIKRNQTTILSSNLLKVIEKMVTNYYMNYMEEQLSYFVSLLELKIESPNIDLSKEVLNNLYFIAKKLAESTVRRDFLQFLLAVSKSNCFFPTDFLSDFQISRLQFSPNMGCLRNVSKEQTRMIVGLCIGVKLFCGYILYRPWTLKLAKTDFAKNFEEIKDFISEYGSVFYYLIMDEFDSIPTIIFETSQKETLQKFKMHSMEKIDIFPKGYQQSHNRSTATDLIPNQNRQFLKRLMKIDRQKLLKIKEYLLRWIDRVTALVLKHDCADDLLASRRSRSIASSLRK